RAMGAPMAPRPIQAMDGVVVMGCSSDRRAGGDRRWVAVGGRAWASAGDGGGEGVDHVSQGLLAADIAGEDHVRHAHDLLGGFPGGEQGDLSGPELALDLGPADAETGGGDLVGGDAAL